MREGFKRLGRRVRQPRVGIPLLVVVGVSAAVSLLHSVGVLDWNPLWDEKALEERAKCLLDTMISRDWKAAAKLVKDSGPEFRLVSDLHRIEEYEIREVKVENDVGKVRVNLRYKISLSHVPQLDGYTLDHEVNQTWEKRSRGWYYVPPRVPTFAEAFRPQIAGTPGEEEGVEPGSSAIGKTPTEAGSLQEADDSGPEKSG